MWEKETGMQVDEEFWGKVGRHEGRGRWNKSRNKEMVTQKVKWLRWIINSGVVAGCHGGFSFHQLLVVV